MLRHQIELQRASCTKNAKTKEQNIRKAEESRGNGGAVESVENQKQVSHFPTAISHVRKPNGKRAGLRPEVNPWTETTS
jgi:hypothetical protein